MPIVLFHVTSHLWNDCICLLSLTSLPNIYISHFSSVSILKKYFVLSHLFFFRYGKYIPKSFLNNCLQWNSVLKFCCSPEKATGPSAYNGHPCSLISTYPSSVSCLLRERRGKCFYWLYSSLHPGTDIIALAIQNACNSIFPKSHGHLPQDLKLHASPRALPCTEPSHSSCTCRRGGKRVYTGLLSKAAGGEELALCI